MIEKVRIKEVKVVKVEKKTPPKNKKYRLLNFTIEDDNSFVLNYIITHNTGPRGANLFRSFFGEEKPTFTLPFIVPTKSKVLAWVSSGTRPTDAGGWASARKEGRAVFAKKTKGMNPCPFLRPSLFELQTVYLDKIAKNVVKDRLSKLNL